MKVKEGKIVDGSWSCDLDIPTQQPTDEIMEILALSTTWLTFWNILKNNMKCSICNVNKCLEKNYYFACPKCGLHSSILRVTVTVIDHDRSCDFKKPQSTRSWSAIECHLWICTAIDDHDQRSWSKNPWSGQKPRSRSWSKRQSINPDYFEPFGCNSACNPGLQRKSRPNRPTAVDTFSNRAIKY